MLPWLTQPWHSHGRLKGQALFWGTDIKDPTNFLHPAPSHHPLPRHIHHGHQVGPLLVQQETRAGNSTVLGIPCNTIWRHSVQFPFFFIPLFSRCLSLFLSVNLRDERHCWHSARCGGLLKSPWGQRFHWSRTRGNSAPTDKSQETE